jgi:hypothetical protein
MKKDKEATINMVDKITNGLIRCIVITSVMAPVVAFAGFALDWISGMRMLRPPGPLFTALTIYTAVVLALIVVDLLLRRK